MTTVETDLKHDTVNIYQKVSLDNSIDITVQSDYLPYTNNIIPDNTQLEDEDNTHYEDDDNAQPEKNVSEPQNIQVVTSDRDQGWNKVTTLPKGWTTRNNLVTIQRSNKMLLARALPTLFVTYHRSFFPKFHNFVEAMKTLGLTLGLHSEIWEDKENKSHQNKIEEALELEGIQYISNPRPAQRGGGAAISLISGEFTLSRLDVIVPKNLEVVWGIVRPK